MSKHTPGPWKVTHNGYANAPYLIHHVESCTDIAEVYCDESPDLPTQTANARLIAAAPDLLEALKSVMVCYGHTFNLERAEALAALIAKAEGK